jgi:hypothetical protein
MRKLLVGLFVLVVAVGVALAAANVTSKTFTLTVTPAPLVITNTSPLPAAQVGIAYSQQMTATGGVAPYTWTATGLPSGLTINPSTGLISGTPGPTSNGTFSSVVVTVTDSQP